MIIAVTGSNGFIGKNIKKHFLTRGQKVISVPRKILYDRTALENFFEEVDVIIHIAGTPITKHWTKHNRKKMFNSRVLTTQNIAHVIDNMENPPGLFISTSAIGIYNNIHYHDESSNDFSDNFLGTLCKAWEAPVKSIETDKTRTIITRLGIVLGDGGILSRLSWLFKMGLGAKIGHGEYPMPLIHIADLLAFYETAIKDTGYEGIYNLTAPSIITNEEFSGALAESYIKKLRFSIPPFILNLIFGHGFMNLINNPIVIPKKLLEAGFKYKYDQIEDALEDCLKKIKNKN
ncbi:MAG: TIGR01777 family oxidoreductase [Candidatus Delongbacteria bacterium]|jgi:uncharacterized protein (TIGR01777 family)|nr:TIGR01777 family oxidoreductase [Candidatus Delongbacteria bacterium]